MEDLMQGGDGGLGTRRMRCAILQDRGGGLHRQGDLSGTGDH